MVGLFGQPVVLFVRRSSFPRFLVSLINLPDTYIVSRNPELIKL